MKIISLPILLQRGAENIVRNWITTVPTMFVIALVLTMFHGLLVVHERAVETIQSVEKKFSITVFLRDDSDPFEIGNLINALEQRKDVVKPVTYITKEKAWELMSKTFELDADLLKKYSFSLPASLTITPRTPVDTDAINAFLQTKAQNLIKDPASLKDKQKNVTTQMINFIQTVQNTTIRTMLFFILVFVVGGTLLLSSTVHLAISARSSEISIMKLVGATYGTIIAPFVIEGVMISLMAFGIHLLLLLALPFERLSGTLNANALLLEFVAVVALGTVVSYLTTLFNIKKKRVI